MNIDLVAQAQLFTRLARALPDYLREPLTADVLHATVRADLAGREARFLRVLRDGVFALPAATYNGLPASPYHALLRHAGVTFEDVERLVAAEGLDAALTTLHAAGVYVSLDEFKGRKPIVRGSLRLEMTSRAFDNPLAITHYAAQSGGSRSGGTRITIDLAHNARSAIYDHLLFETHGLLERPYVLWQPTLPYGAGVNALLRYAKLGRRVDRWFSQHRTPGLGDGWQHGLLTRYILWAARVRGESLPRPQHVPLAEAERIAAYLATLAARGTPALVNSNASSGTRICLAARERGLDIAGTVLRLGGEPLTPARARVVAATGARAITVYGMGEIGRIGLPCADASEVDDVHLLLDKLAVIRPVRQGAGAAPTPVMVFSTLDGSTPKLMLNVESDDYGELGTRPCGCLLGGLGLTTHLHTIRSHEKLTSEGMNFLGHDLIRLVEEVLPAAFGGGPTDYQFVEDEDERGLPVVQLVISPRLGSFQDGQVLACLSNFMARLPGGGTAYGDRWREAGALRVVRREPYTTSASKVLALHTMKSKPELRSGEREVTRELA